MLQSSQQIKIVLFFQDSFEDSGFKLSLGHFN